MNADATCELLDRGFEALGLLDPQRHLRIAVGAYPPDAIGVPNRRWWILVVIGILVLAIGGGLLAHSCRQSSDKAGSDNQARQNDNEAIPPETPSEGAQP